MHTRRMEKKASVEEGRGKIKEMANTGSEGRKRVTKNNNGGVGEEGKGERLAFPPPCPSNTISVHNFIAKTLYI